VLDERSLDAFRKSIVIDGRPTQPAAVKFLRHEGDKTWLEITLREGRNRQVRRMVEALGSKVVTLARIKLGAIAIGTLPIGKWRMLTHEEVAALR